MPVLLDTEQPDERGDEKDHRGHRQQEQHGVEHESVATSINRVLTVATIDTLIVVLVVVDMTTKPGL